MICGLAFKGFPETADIRYSTTLDFIDLVTKKNKDIQIFVYDPIIKKNEINKINLEYKNIFNLTSKKFMELFFLTITQVFVILILKK